MKITRRQPLFIVSGASGVGKSSLCEALFHKEKEYIVMESDLLWREVYNTPEDNYREYRQTWMRVCASISQIGLPVVLCGCALPEQFETLSERRLFTEIYYMAAVCEEQTLEKRMREGRGIVDEGWIRSSLDFNQWLYDHGTSLNPPVYLLDTTLLTVEQAADKANTWIMECMRKS